MSTTPKQNRRWFLAFLAGLVGAAVLLLYPVESTVCPAWTIQIVDEAGRPLNGAFVRQHWQDYSVESRSHEQDARTDANGYVSFPERTIRAGILWKALGATVNTLTQGVHASYGAHAFVAAYGDIVNGKRLEGSVSYSPGMPLPKQLVARIHDLGLK